MPRILAKDSKGPTNTIFKQGMSQKSLDKRKVLQPTLVPLSKASKQVVEADDGFYTLTDEENKRNENRLTYLQSSLFGTILEDTVTQLRVLGNCNTELRIIKTQIDWNQLLAEKFNVKNPLSVDDLVGINPKRLESDEYKIKKLDSDKKVITDIITSTYRELCMCGTYNFFEDHINTILVLDRHRKSLAEEETKNKILRHELHRQLRQQRNHQKSFIYDTEIKIDDLKTQVEDSVLMSETKNRYINNWQNAREEQHVQSIHDTESTYAKSVNYFKQRSDQEQRVHMEIEMLHNIFINETLLSIEVWMDKYDTDMENIDLKIQIQSCAYQDMLAKRMHLEETIVKHDNLSKDWVAFKDKRAKALAYRQTMTRSAIMVQAWWHGLLVRLEMGPYRVAKRGKVKAAGAAAAEMLKKAKK